MKNFKAFYKREQNSELCAASLHPPPRRHLSPSDDNSLSVDPSRQHVNTSYVTHTIVASLARDEPDDGRHTSYDVQR